MTETSRELNIEQSFIDDIENLGIEALGVELQRAFHTAMVKDGMGDYWRRKAVARDASITFMQTVFGVGTQQGDKNDRDN